MTDAPERRILLVEDDFEVAEFLSFYLAKSIEYCICDLAGTGELALERLQKQSYGLMITDIAMPGMGGFGLLECIKNMYPRMVRGISTAKAVTMEDVARRFPEVFFVLQKPFKAELLLEMANRALSKTFSETTENMPQPSRASKNDSNQENLYPYIVGGLLHDAINTLMGLQCRVERLDTCSESDANRDMARLKPGMDRLVSVLHLLQEITREYYAPDQQEPGGANERLEEIVRDMKNSHPDIAYVSECEEDIDQSGIPPGILYFILGELLTNASRAMSGQAGHIHLHVTYKPGSKALHFACEDQGTGFPAGIIEKAATGSLTPPEKGERRGYGLYLISQIASRLNGVFLLSNRAEGGAHVELILPTVIPEKGDTNA